VENIGTLRIGEESGIKEAEKVRRRSIENKKGVQVQALSA